MTWRRVSTRTRSYVCPSTVAPGTSGTSWLSGPSNIECTLIMCAGLSRCPDCCEYSPKVRCLCDNRCILYDKLSLPYTVLVHCSVLTFGLFCFCIMSSLRLGKRNHLEQAVTIFLPYSPVVFQSRKKRMQRTSSYN